MKTDAAETHTDTNHTVKATGRFKDLTGEVFGRLTAMSRAPNRGERVCWHCICSCGNQKEVTSKVLINGETTSCGCYGKERRRAANTIHGQAGKLEDRPKGTNTYAIWMAMMSRCNNPNTKAYLDYGGRGIKPCAAMATFVGFYDTMGERPAGLSIDRINNNAGYFCGKCEECQLNERVKNVRWATRLQQNNNRRPPRRTNII